LSEAGDPADPTLVFVHGYPDTHAVWDELVERLSIGCHTVAYDVRGIGHSTAPNVAGAFALEELALDLGAVLDAVSPEQPVHLVGHDWGAFQCWEAVTQGQFAGRIASLTAVARPRLDGSLRWALRRLRPSPSALREIAGQARRSWYVAAFHIPALPERALQSGFERGWATVMRRLEGIEPRPGHPAATLASDARAGLELYRANMRGFLRNRPADPTTVPAQLIAPTRDRYIEAALYDDASDWATWVWRRTIRAGHWVQRSHPDVVARAVEELVHHLEGGPELSPLRRARYERKRRRLEGRLAVVTGAGSGIGRATALALAGEGAEVIAADIDVESAKDTVGRADRDAYMHAAQLDVGDGRAMERSAEEVEREHGVAEVVVNNAGIGVGGPFLDTTLEDWERIIDVNLWGVIHGSRPFASAMVRAGVEGHIVNVASAAAFAPSRVLPAYSTTKAAVLMLSECMRAEVQSSGIGVTAICPGLVNTNIVRTTHLVGVSEEQERRLQERGARAYGLRGYSPERIAAAIVRAIRINRAVVPVTPEARVMLAMSQLTPGVLRRLARIELAGAAR
jgi:NAD(P)-dependent dehydrogenase (short-subunit alcohol dehydrogenase family)/pimeloyl-ACP methyl ester carboxylesterase